MRKFDLGFEYTNIHFIGIGGINMSALAESLFKDGYIITGSDQADSDTVAHLRNLGMVVHVGHDAANLDEHVKVVVYNAAVPDANPERVEGAARNLLFLDRAELLGLLMRNFSNAICVAGTHGKTTTTSMLAEIFMQADCDPTVMSGGFLPSMGGAMRIGTSKEYFIAESCEYHNSFLKFFPFVGVILNLEMDHLDYFGGIKGLRASFRSFAEKIPAEGALIINKSIDGYKEITDGLLCKVILFGDDELGFDLSIPGAHNIQNAQAALAVAKHFALDSAKVEYALKNFTGAHRRFQKKGMYNDALIIDDYAHHPTEVEATLTAARELSPARLWVVFQPHTHNRTHNFLNEFAQALLLADEIIVPDIYKPAGREEERAIVHSKNIVSLTGRGVYLPDFDDIVAHLKANLQPNDLVITMGAGNVYKVADSLLGSAEGGVH